MSFLKKVRAFFSPPNPDQMCRDGDIAGLVKLLDHYDEEIRKQAATELEILCRTPERMQAVNEELVAALIRALDNTEVRVRSAAMGALRVLGTVAVEPLITALRHPHPEVRWRAARILGDLGEPRASEPLVARLQDPERVVRDNSAVALANLKDSRAFEPLLVAFEQGDNDILKGWVRHDAAICLGRLGDARAVPTLIAGLEQRGEHSAIVEALGQIGDKRAFEPLIALGKGADKYLRPDVLRALEGLADDPVSRQRMETELAQECQLCGALSIACQEIAFEPVLTAIQKNRLPTPQMMAYTHKSHSLSALSEYNAMLDWIKLARLRAAPYRCCPACQDLILHWENHPERQYE